MRFALILFIALGFVLSVVVGIEYKCKGEEMFPTYYGSPLIFKQESLASSMEYFYSVSNLIINVLAWSFALLLINGAIQRIIKKTGNLNSINIPYRIVIGLMVAFSTLSIAINLMMIGRGFEKNSNYWYWDIDNEAKVWRVKCEGELVFLK